ncbi:MULTISPECIES: hypothetical protein [Streptomyces]|uniref:hypothetical protein n=1 Tax=Streptomyces TaxID=1883 RepID=UPI0016776DDE|nr:hypothetical protein [Streptomyces viridodiastaticus]GHG00376.1 hypothetical protein GCM10018777_08730 [Streptomyces viridodiastaticus]
MSAAAGRVGRFYTAARRHPWVLGKVADWKIPLGPYTPAQIAVAVGGGFLLVKTISLWSWMGPVPIVAWVLAVWATRRPKIGGRAPLQAALGWVLLAWQPHGGRIGGRAARDRAARALLGGFTVEGAPSIEHGAVPSSAPAAVPDQTAQRAAGRRPRRSSVTRTPTPRRQAAPARQEPVGPVSGVQRLLALAEQGGGVR